jgi:hypothetical protein
VFQSHPFYPHTKVAYIPAGWWMRLSHTIISHNFFHGFAGHNRAECTGNASTGCLARIVSTHTSYDPAAAAVPADLLSRTVSLFNIYTSRTRP